MFLHPIQRKPSDDNMNRHTYMILAELATLTLYIGSMVLLPEYFGMSFDSLQL
jgi:hypothetical protein